MIVRSNKGYHVKSESGKNLGGPYTTEEEAAKRLKQIEYLKYLAGKKKK